MSEQLPEQQVSQSLSVAGELRLLSNDNHRLSNDELEAKATRWMSRLAEPDVTPRARDEIVGLLDRIDFELRWRNGEFQHEQTPDFMPAEWGEGVV